MKRLSAVAAFAAVSLHACAQEPSPSAPAATDREAIEQIVRDYILENPEIVEEALIVLAERQQAEKDAALASAVERNWDALYTDARDFSIGPDDAEVTIVEFFDYRCGFCKRSWEWVNSLPAQYDGKVRVVFKEFPILSPESRQAAFATLAAGEQGKYLEMHQALMRSKGELKQDQIEEIAREVGVDVAKMTADAKSLEVQKQVADIRSLADALDTRATPTFFVNGIKVAGADQARVEAMIEEAIS